MDDLVTELFSIARRLEKLCAQAEKDELAGPLSALKAAVKDTAKAWSGSWLGYQANVYYETLRSPPSGLHFRQEWGLMDQERVGWRELDSDMIRKAIHELAGNPNIKPAEALAAKARSALTESKPEALSLLSAAQESGTDNFLVRLQEELDGLKAHSQAFFLRTLRPSGQVITRDSLAVGQGLWTPPHLALASDIFYLEQQPTACLKLAQICQRAGSHLQRRERQRNRSARAGTNVFIGHGRSNSWRDLKDFIQDRLKLPWDEFNRVPAAGVTNIARLSEMLDAAAIAFLVMTGEDEQADGRLHARMNVVHEAGLFQGRLGFTHAIVLIEGECEEFSNIEGLGQIRFPKGNIKAIFEDVRQILERENIIDT